MILQQLERYELSSRDLEIADKQVEILDLSRNAAHEIGKYLFSDNTGPYKAPPYEKLLVNTENMVNYLARGDLNGARIEARRLTVMQTYLSEHKDPAESLNGPGSYLAGFTFEKSGQADEALRYYDEALAYGSYRTLAEPVHRLMAKGSVSSPRLREIASTVTGDSGADDDGEILVVVSFGRVPPKIAKRVPIGLALTFAADALSPNDVDQANRLAAQGLVTWVNYPELGHPHGAYDIPEFALDRQRQTLEGMIAIDREAHRAWEDAKGTVVAAAITRMITRIVAGEAVRQTTSDGVVGALLSLGVQATLTATDTPDTRSWQTLPARIAFGRARVRPGRHEVVLMSRGIKKRQTVDVAPGGWAVVAQTVLF
jgi:tetratricopeptide (TPR) repeat protein